MFKSIAMNDNNSAMKEGEYEVYLGDCGFSQTKSGIECIKFEFIVRADIEQPYKNLHKFKLFYKDRDTGKWPVEKVGKYANALGIETGKDFELEELIGMSAVMVISNYVDKNTGQTKDNIYYIKPSKAKPFMSAASFVEMEDEDVDGDLPFM